MSGGIQKVKKFVNPGAYNGRPNRVASVIAAPVKSAATAAPKIAGSLRRRGFQSTVATSLLGLDDDTGALTTKNILGFG